MTRTKRKGRRIYTKGEANRLIDSLIHPLLDQDPGYSLVDLILHGLVEQDPSETALKFLRYSLPQLIAEYISRFEKEKM